MKENIDYAFHEQHIQIDGGPNYNNIRRCAVCAQNIFKERRVKNVKENYFVCADADDAIGGGSYRSLRSGAA